jgi:hypothetical protein
VLSGAKLTSGAMDGRRRGGRLAISIAFMKFGKSVAWTGAPLAVESGLSRGLEVDGRGVAYAEVSTCVMALLVMHGTSEVIIALMPASCGGGRVTISTNATVGNVIAEGRAVVEDARLVHVVPPVLELPDNALTFGDAVGIALGEGKGIVYSVLIGFGVVLAEGM